MRNKKVDLLLQKCIPYYYYYYLQMKNAPPLFPLLEPTQPPIDPSEAEEEVRARVSWLLKAEKANQTQFFQYLLHSEPSFPATHAAVLRAGDVGLTFRWLKLEQGACRKKLVCRRPQLKRLCQQKYGIVLQKKKKDTFKVAFPFEEEWEPEVKGGEAELFDLLSTRAFPAHDDGKKYQRVAIPVEAVEVVKKGFC
jgi:hypothetical protein